MIQKRPALQREAALPRRDHYFHAFAGYATMSSELQDSCKLGEAAAAGCASYLKHGLELEDRFIKRRMQPRLGLVPWERP